jgi:hypothetical protein
MELLSLNLNLFNHCKVLPLQNSDHSWGFSVGGYFSNGDIIKDIILQRHYGECGIVDIPNGIEYKSNVQDVVIYGGILFNHFGHFILESLSRYWILKNLNNVKIAWHVRGQDQILNWQKEIFNLLNIDTDNFIIINQPYIFENLMLASPGYIMNTKANNFHLSTLKIQSQEKNEKLKSKKIWLSRSNLKEYFGGVNNEKELEKILLDEGFEIVFPEKLNVTEQLDIYSQAEVLAGFEGSAFHSIVFLSSPPPLIIILQRRIQGIHPNYITIADCLNLNQVVIQVDLEIVSGENVQTRFVLKNVPETIKAIKDHL